VGLKQTETNKNVPVFSLCYCPQIKLTPYDFNDLQLIAKIENRTGTERFLTLFHYVFTNYHIGRCPAGSHTKDYGARSFYTVKTKFKYNDVYINIRICHYTFNKNSKSGSDGGENHTARTVAVKISRF